MNEIQAHAVGSTGNASGTVQHADGLGQRVAVEFKVEAVGATPTVSWQVEGSINGTDWFSCDLIQADGTVAGSNAVVTQTAVGTQIRYVDGLDKRWFSALRVRTTANTNVTFSSKLYTPSASGMT